MTPEVELEILKATIETITNKYLAEKERANKFKNELKRLKEKYSVNSYYDDITTIVMDGQISMFDLGDIDHPSYVIGEQLL